MMLMLILVLNIAVYGTMTTIMRDPPLPIIFVFLFFVVFLIKVGYGIVYVCSKRKQKKKRIEEKRKIATTQRINEHYYYFVDSSLLKKKMYFSQRVFVIQAICIVFDYSFFLFFFLLLSLGQCVMVFFLCFGFEYGSGVVFLCFSIQFVIVIDLKLDLQRYFES